MGRAESAASAASGSPKQPGGEDARLPESAAAASRGMPEGCRGGVSAGSQAGAEAAAALFASLACSSQQRQQQLHLGAWPAFGPTSFVAMPVHVAAGGTASSAEARTQAAAEGESQSPADAACTAQHDAWDQQSLGPSPDAQPTGKDGPQRSMSPGECSSVPGTSAPAAASGLSVLSDSEAELLPPDSCAGLPALPPSGRAAQGTLRGGGSSGSAHSRKGGPLVARGLLPASLSSSDSEGEAELQRLERKYSIAQRRVPLHGAPGRGVAGSRQVVDVVSDGNDEHAADAACRVSVSNARRHMSEQNESKV